MGGAMAEKPEVTIDARVGEANQVADPRIPGRRRWGIDGCDELCREIRTENTLTDRDGNEVKWKQDAHGEVTMKADAEDTTPWLVVGLSAI
jgi:hypothetical protein